MNAPVLPFTVIKGKGAPRARPSDLGKLAARLERERPEHVAYVADLVRELLQPEDAPAV